MGLCDYRGDGISNAENSGRVWERTESSQDEQFSNNQLSFKEHILQTGQQTVGCMYLLSTKLICIFDPAKKLFVYLIRGSKL
jgi:hypothetical protein